MPFVMMCGLPSSGKSFYAKVLADHLKNNMNKNVIIVDDGQFLIEKNSVYMSECLFQIKSWIFLF